MLSALLTGALLEPRYVPFSSDSSFCSFRCGPTQFLSETRLALSFIALNRQECHWHYCKERVFFYIQLPQILIPETGVSSGPSGPGCAQFSRGPGGQRSGGRAQHILAAQRKCSYGACVK